MTYMEQGIEMQTSTGGGLLKGLSAPSQATAFSSAPLLIAAAGKRAWRLPRLIRARSSRSTWGSLTLFVRRRIRFCARRRASRSRWHLPSAGRGLFGGEGFILQRLEGNGLVFVHAGGTIIEKDLGQASVARDTGCLVALRHR